MKRIHWTPELLAQLKAAWDAAVKAGEEAFEFLGYKFSAEYARYLIELLEHQFQQDVAKT